MAGSYFFGAAWKEIFYFILFIGVLVFRPAGLFGQRGAETLGVDGALLRHWGAVLIFGLAAADAGAVCATRTSSTASC